MTNTQDLRVLVVEDDFFVADLLCGLVEEIGGCVVHKAVSGDEAVSLTDWLRPDVVLMDLALPGIDGVEATRQITSRCPTPIVAVSAYGDRERVEAASAAGIGAFVAKPPTALDIERAITIAIHRFGDVARAEREREALEARLEEQRRQAGERLRSLERSLEQRRAEALGTLAGGIAHRFNNLLTVILGHVELALEHAHDPAVSDGLQSALRAGHQAAELAEQMLAYAGRRTLHQAPVDLDALADGTIRPLAEAAAPGVAIDWRPSPDKKPTIMADAAKVRHLLAELVMNAIEASRHAALPRVTVRTGLDADAVWLSVEDSGPGIPAQVRDRIFEPFYTTKFTGRGLGLAAVEGIARGHGARIDVTSPNGAGTVVRVTFPPNGAQEEPPDDAAAS